LKLREDFPGAELVCDAHTPFVVWTDNLQLAFSRVKARLRWKLKHGRDVEGWGQGIMLLMSGIISMTQSRAGLPVDG
jgi:hypothetical protein